ncbi:unnamed protein product, partial [Pylaiella littoralis]
MVDATALNPNAGHSTTLLNVYSFMVAVQEGDSAAGRLLTPYCRGEVDEEPVQAIEECLRTPTVVSMVDVNINRSGFVWNTNDLVIPIACSPRRYLRAHQDKFQNATYKTSKVRSYEKVFVMTQEYTPNHYHFTVEHLPRIMVFLDVLLENEDIKIALHYHKPDHDLPHAYKVHAELLELLGINRERIIHVEEDIHAGLAILPTSTVCGDPDTHMVNMLRHALLQALFPGSGGVPRRLPRPLIILVVRQSKRGLQNNDAVKLALQSNFPDYDVIEFFGTDPVRQQLETFATAAMIVAPHGAGLINILAAPLHTPVLEIAPIHCPPCFLRLALKLHHIYARHPAG